ncbi:apolipoprotein N-acyltransferase [Alteromonas gilva]|uniref:Apolipoprotein N-acyltransferase n=1 Tax=Alteromonas gilva TaxID=2987522 RepID=A0ABT5L439_9ALTE|nr:apolipoprotein N-acyltransferase [Alteromonas gilva]MDC8830543.1 apolipoprotein N-acyltransferase [Alteromonas gilva]
MSLTMAYAPFNLWLITPVAVALAVRQLYVMTHQQSAFWLGWCFGLGWFGAGISWVHVSIADFGGLPLVASLLLMALLCGYLALFPALSFYLTRRFILRPYWPLALPIIWLFTEWLRSWLLTGFPWLSLGYSQLDSPLAGWLPVIGETGVSLLLMAIAVSVAQATLTKKIRHAVTVTAVIALSGIVLNRVSWVDEERSIAIGMAQGNIAQSLRWVPEQDLPTMQTYQDLTQVLWDNDLIIWPEAAVPKLEVLAQDYIKTMDTQATAHNTAIVTGVVNYNFENDEAWNNLIVLGKQQPADDSGHYHYFHANRYAKHHLLPVGEFVPFEDWLRPLAPLFDLPMSSFNRGDFQQQNLTANGLKLAPAICFEIAFPRQVSANLYADTDFIITVSNDAWFGHSHGPAQHLQIARMRAKEFGLPVIRSTNNGISAFVDYRGNIVAQLPQFERAAMSATLTTTIGVTPYRYAGDWPLYLASIITLAGLLLSQRRRKDQALHD